MKKTSKNIWFKIALLFFILAAGMGLLMRLLAVFSIEGIDYGYLRQGHSHVAFLGWGYLTVVILLIQFFLPKGSLRLKKYKWNLILTVVFIAGMFFSFPATGYKVVSITLLILFLITSLHFVFQFLRDYWKTKHRGISRLFINGAFLFYLLSGIGPFALGPIVLLLGKSPTYYLAVYYYLHFLYNGFFVFVIFALLFKYLENNLEKSNSFSLNLNQNGRRFFWLSFLAVIPAYALSTLWIKPHLAVYLAGGVAAVIQIAAFYYFLPFLKIIKTKFSGITAFMLSAALLSFLAKLILQLLSAFPWFADKTYEAKSFVVIAYIHLVVLGFISLFLLAWIIQYSVFNISNFRSKSGLWMFLTGFIFSEILLFSKGLMQWINISGSTNFHELLFGASLLMPLGLIVFWAGQWQASPKVSP